MKNKKKKEKQEIEKNSTCFINSNITRTNLMKKKYIFVMRQSLRPAGTENYCPLVRILKVKEKERKPLNVVVVPVCIIKVS